MIYADSSFLISLYAADANSPTAAVVYAKDQRQPLFFTPWQAFELRNALAVATGRIPRVPELPTA